MERLIPIINKLQDVFHSVGMLDTIDLPQIAVVGSQSSGKSSVLENIVGRDFLPRGTGIVTRRPLVLQLIHTPKNQNATASDEQAQQKSENNNEEWGEFLHMPNKKIFDFDQLRQEINNETDRLTGKNKGISPLPIHLKIYSPHVLNLTLIDLPGITKVPVGDQPRDIENQIRNMILQYISKPNCIILAVTAANTDLANSDALKLAAEVDKRGDRTLGVLTKLDLMDRGTDAVDVLSGKVIPLKRGFIGVVNRGQSDINSNKSIREAVKDEALFFQKHPAYKSMAERMGTRYLAKTLNTILLNHIREVLPEIRTKISALIQQAQQRLGEYGVPVSESNMSNGALLLQLLTKFSTDYNESIEGRNVDLTTNDLFGGARINHIFTKKFLPFLLKMDSCENLNESDIRTAIRNAKGPRTSLFIPEAAFEMLVKRQVKQLEEPAIRCVDQVFEELATVVEHCEKGLTRFPNLKDRTKEFVITLLREYQQPLKTFIVNLIQIEMAYINTNHPDFFNGGQSAFMLINQAEQPAQQMQQQPQQPMQQGRQPPIPQQQQQPQPHLQPINKPKEEDEWFNVSKTQPKQPSKTTPTANLPTKPTVNTSTPPARRPPPKQSFLSNFFGGRKELDDLEDEEESNPHKGVQNEDPYSYTYSQPNAKNATPAPEPEPVVVQQQPVYQEQYDNSHQYNTLGNIPQITDYNSYQNAATDREKRESDIIRALLKEYFNIVRKSISDSVPKAVMCFLVNKSKADLQSELVRHLYKEDLFEELLRENDAVAAKRKATAKMLVVLQNAQQIIAEVRDLRL